MMPQLTASAEAPRIAAVERPFGLTLELPDDASGQLTVLRATLQAPATISERGAVVDLQLEWTHDAKLDLYPPQPPPIVSYLRWHPWAFCDS